MLRDSAHDDNEKKKDEENKRDGMTATVGSRQDTMGSRLFQSMSLMTQSLFFAPVEPEEKERVLEEKGEEKEIKIVMREACDVSQPSLWPNCPVLLCVNTAVSSSPQASHAEKDAALPLGVPFHFSSDLFEGLCLVRLRDVLSDNPESDASYFDGRKRLFQSIIQGRFKENLRVSDVLTGHEFVRPLKGLPPSWILRAGTLLIQRIAPGTEIELDTGQPRAMSVLAATSQVLRADRPGDEPEIACRDIEEDTTQFGGFFSEGNISSFRRKWHLSDPQNAAKYTYDTDSIYTFDFYQNLLHVGTYSLDLGFTKIDLAEILNGQPIQVLSKTVDGKYLWSFQIWHESLLPKAEERF